MKKLILWVSLLVLLLTACNASSGDGNVVGGMTTTGTNANTAAVTAQDYYRYLNEVFIPERSLASTDPITLEIDTMDFHYAWNLSELGGKGLVSAVVEDFDNDGAPELLAVEMEDSSIMNTFYNRVVFDDGVDYDPEVRCVLLRAWLFDYADSEIVEQAYGTLILMPETSWGKMVVGIEKVENEYYLFANVNGENMSTYGPSQFTVTQIGGDSLAPMYSSVLDYGRANASNYLELMGIHNSIDIRESTLSDLRIPHYEYDEETYRDYLGNRLLCVVDFNYVEFGGDEMVVTLTDFTNLREYLQNNGNGWKRIEFPEGVRKERPTVPAEVETLISALSAESGVALTMDSCQTNGGLCEVTYKTASGNSLSLRWDVEKNQLQWLGVSAYKEMPDDEWYSLKDAVLDHGILELTEDQKALFYGQIKNWTDYMNGIELGMYMISVFSVGRANFTASRIA